MHQSYYTIKQVIHHIKTARPIAQIPGLDGRDKEAAFNRRLIANLVGDCGNLNERNLTGDANIDAERRQIIDAAHSHRSIEKILEEATYHRTGLFVDAESSLIDLEYLLRRCGMVSALGDRLPDSKSLVLIKNEIEDGMHALTESKSDGTFDEFADEFAAEARKLLEEFQFTDDHPAYALLQLAAS